MNDDGLFDRQNMYCAQSAHQKARSIGIMLNFDGDGHGHSDGDSDGTCKWASSGIILPIIVFYPGTFRSADRIKNS